MEQETNSSSLKEKTVKGLFWGAMNSVMMQILNAVFGIVLMLNLTPKDYGMTGVLAIYSAIAGSLQDSGFVSALTNKRDATHRDYNSVFWFNVLCSALIYIILWFCAPFIANYNHEPKLIWLSRYAFLGFFFASFSITPRAILLKELKVKEQTICGVVALLVSGTVGITMALHEMAYWSLATQYIVFVSVVSLLSWYFSGWLPSLNFSFKPIKEMFGFSCKLLITNIFNNINKYAFEGVLGKFYSKNDIGNYTQANKWNLMGSNTITGMVQSVAQPMFVQVGDDKERLQRSFRKMLRFTAFVSFPLMFGLCLVSKEFISLFPTNWLPTIPLLQILCIGGAFLPITTLYSNFVISRGKSDIFMWNTICQSLLIIANVFIVQYLHLELFGLSGIKLMVVFYVNILALWIVIWHYFVWKEIKLSFFVALVDILPFMLIASLTMLATYYATIFIANAYLSLISRIIIAAIIYIGILYVIKANILKECVEYLIKKNKTTI